MRSVIQCNGVGKRYRIGDRARYDTLRETLAAAAAAPLRMLTQGSSRRQAPEIWSLRDVSFTVGESELVGIIGRNGAGKSTLLRIIAGITEPTEGRVAVRGRVGSLLEVGTGFHPELTGRENVFLSGAILGMSRRETRRRFDEIVAFAEIERFLDTPVKRYSSGMYMRLAFSVAAHLDTDILLVDEILAVGDAAFQRKSIDAMGNLASARRTILFVSHDLGAIQRLCTRAMLLDQGRVVLSGPTDAVILRYLSADTLRTGPAREVSLEQVSRRGTGEARFVSVIYGSPDPSMGGHPFTDGPLEVTAEISATEAMRAGSVELFIRDHRGVKLLDADTALLGQSFLLPKGRSRFTFLVPRLPLNPGIYHLGLWLARSVRDGAGLDHVDPAVQIEVLARDSARLVGYSAAYGPVAAHFDISAEGAVAES
jgi:lipopolysaccharide transport system ATP-binding protein